MLILHVLEATQGGTRRHVLDLIPHLQGMGLQNSLAYSLDRYLPFQQDADALQKRGVAVFSVPMSPRPQPGSHGAALRRLAAIIRQQKPDVIHCHSSVAGALGRLAAALAAPGTPVIYTPHCIAFATGLSLARRRVARVLEGVLAPLTSQFIAVSRDESRILRATVASSRPVHVIPNGINLDEFDALAPTTQAVASAPGFAAGCFGRLSRQKNQETLLRAWARLQPNMPGARLLLVGSGPAGEALRSLAARLKLEGLVCWAGDLPEARHLYFSCQLVVQPSRWEGCPYAVLEAMAARRGVVASDVGGVPEVLGQTGVLAARRSAPLAAAIEALWGEEELRRHLGQAARARVEELFTAERMAAATASVYRQATADASGYRPAKAAPSPA